MEKGDVVSVRCKIHGNRKLVAGADFGVDTPRSLIGCPYCSPTMSHQTKPPGFGFRDHNGVAYIYDWAGRARILSDLNEAQKAKIQAAKEAWLSEQRRLTFEEERKKRGLLDT